VKPKQTIRAWKGRKPRDALESNSARDALAPLANPMSSEASYEIYQNLPKTKQLNNTTAFAKTMKSKPGTAKRPTC